MSTETTPQVLLLGVDKILFNGFIAKTTVTLNNIPEVPGINTMRVSLSTSSKKESGDRSRWNNRDNRWN